MEVIDMLTGKCQKTVSLLLREDDFNVRITVAQNATAKSRFTTKSLIEGIWKEYIRDSVGELLNTDKSDYFTEILIIKDETSKKIEATLTGKQIAQNLVLQSVLDADGIRITVIQANGKQLSWIIVKP
jgi:hypothetical protein